MGGRLVGRIMLIDDHYAMGVIFRTLLEALGCDIAKFDFCQDVDSAVTRLQTDPHYQIIFLDHSVPPTYHFRKSLDLLRNVDPRTQIVLISGLIPSDFGTNEMDSRIVSCMDKDQLSAKSLHNLLTSLEVPLAS